MFRELAKHYTTASSYETGDPLDALIDEDWQVFSDTLLDRGHSQGSELLLAILEFGLDPKDDVDEPDYRDLYTRRDASAVDLHGDWDERLDLLLQHPAASPSEPPSDAPPDSAEFHFDAVVDAVETVGLEYTTERAHFRARIHKDRSRRTRFLPDELGAPPPEKVLAARANRAGEPVLYLASDEQTALAEVRAWKGALIAVAPMALVRPVRILNLVKIRPIGSPFGIEGLTWLLEARGLLQRFGAELSRPIIPGEEPRHYLPSQHICDVARQAGFDGVAYPSAMGAGHNVALFDIGAAKATTVTYHRVTSSRIRIENYTQPEVAIDDWLHD